MQFKKFYLERVVMGFYLIPDSVPESQLNFLQILVDCFLKIEEVWVSKN